MIWDFVIGDETQGRYILFSAIGSKCRVRAFYLSNVYNKKGKFEVLEELRIDDLATINGQIKQTRDILLNVKSNRKNFFSS